MILNMSFRRINALLFRYLYLYPRSLPRLLDLLFWPVIDLLLWGFLSLYLEKLNLENINILSVLLGAIIFWSLMSRSQEAVTIAFLEDVWEKNLLNVFVTPLKVREFLSATVLLGVIRIVLQGIILGLIALVLYHFNIFQFGFYTLPFVLSLLIFGWVLGLFILGIILRFGTSAQVLAFGFIFLIQPFSAVFYPVSALPAAIQWVAYLFPSTYVFEGMRSVIATGSMPWTDMAFSFGINAVLMAFVLSFFVSMFRKVKEKGLLLKLD